MRLTRLAVIPIAALAAVTAYTWAQSGHRSAASTGETVATIAIPPQYQAIAARYAPQTQHLTVDCGGQSIPVPMLAAPGGSERSPGAAADALRAFFGNNPWAGMGDVSPTNWALLVDSPTQAIFGQRTGRIGIGSVVVFSRHGDEFTPAEETGCSTVRTGPNTIAEPISSATASGATLTLRWITGSNCGDGPARTDRVLDHVTVLETSTAVRVLLTSRPASDAGATHGACGGVGLQGTATAQLRQPLGHRHLLDDARVPSTAVAPS